MRTTMLMLGLLLSSGMATAQGVPPRAASPAQHSWSEDDQLFIAPSGEPFHAPAGAAYPSAAWFAQADRNHDGRVSEAEFAADFVHFFDKLDADHDGIVRDAEIKAYEQDIAPEVRSFDRGFEEAAPSEGHQPGGHGRRGRAGRGRGGNDEGQDSRTSAGGDDIVPEVGKSSAIENDLRSERSYGGGQFSMINIPEPISSMDIDFSGSVSREEMRAAAHRRFALLNRDGQAFLTLANLPETYAQQHPRRAGR